MTRAGVRQTVAMSIIGHRAVRVVNRCSIAVDAGRREALTRAKAHLAAVSSERNVAAIAGHGQNTDKPAPETGRD